MSDSGRYSIWKGEPAMDSWYSAAITANFDSVKGRGDTDMEEMLFFDIAKSNQVKYPSGDANNWFYGVSTDFNPQIEQSKLLPKSDGSAPKLDSIALVLPPTSITRRISTSKALPPVPSSPTSFAPNGDASAPYFDYIFANDGFAETFTYAKHSPDNLSFEVDNDAMDDSRSGGYASDQEEETPSPEHEVPATPENTQDLGSFHYIDDSGFTTHKLYQAGIPIAAQKLLENGRAAVGTNLAKQFFYYNNADEAEKSAATTDFYSSFAVEGSPSPYHAPLADEFTEFGDVRDGAEVSPKQWQDSERRSRAYTVPEADAMDEDYSRDVADTPFRSVLKPISRKLVFAKTTTTRAQSPTVFDITADGSSDEGSNSSSRSTNDHPHLHPDKPPGKKRNARDSFVTKSTYDTSSSDDEDVKYLYTKKIRITPENSDEGLTRNIRQLSSYSLLPNHDQDEITRNNTDVASISSVRPEPTPVGYPGQFCGMKTNEQAIRSAITSHSFQAQKQTLTMGDYLHPNYLYTHTDFHPCLHQDKLEYNEFTAPPSSQIARCIESAWALSVYAAETPRTAAEEALRREVHHECTAARLEGVSVGQYRYYQGHLNIEEYKEAGMCVCWEACECSKLCTHFGDLLCPCSKHIEIHQH